MLTLTTAIRLFAERGYIRGCYDFFLLRRV